MKRRLLEFFIFILIIVDFGLLCCYFAKPEWGFVIYIMAACDLVLLFSFLHLRHKAK